MKKIYETKLAPAPVGPYSQAVEVDNFIYCSGQIAINPVSGQVLQGSIGEQTKQVMENIKAVLETAGVGFENVFKTTIFLLDMTDFVAVNEIYGSYFKSKFPARSTIAVVGLPKGVRVEIEVIAYRGH